MAKHWKTTGKGTAKADCEGKLANRVIAVPAGTDLIQIDGRGWAVASQKVAIELSGDAHDATYQFIWVPADAVKVVW